jgi:hypothetical protein
LRNRLESLPSWPYNFAQSTKVNMMLRRDFFKLMAAAQWVEPVLPPAPATVDVGSEKQPAPV